MSEMHENLTSRNIKLTKMMHRVQGVVAGTTKNEPTMQENLKLRSLKVGFYCICCQ
jgi:hypothetical protein